MEYREALAHLAPCGLDCSRCADYTNGEIRALSLQLSHLLRGYARVAKMKAEKAPEFGSYAHFEDVLEAFTRGPCGGCRSENVQCPIPCKAKTCHKEKGVDFCFQCQDYPCDDPTFAPIKERWRQRNDRMKDIGVVRFYEEQIKLPRY
jgi:hypothetical protein